MVSVVPACTVAGLTGTVTIWLAPRAGSDQSNRPPSTNSITSDVAADKNVRAPARLWLWRAVLDTALTVLRVGRGSPSRRCPPVSGDAYPRRGFLFPCRGRRAPYSSPPSPPARQSPALAAPSGVSGR